MDLTEEQLKDIRAEAYETDESKVYYINDETIKRLAKKYDEADPRSIDYIIADVIESKLMDESRWANLSMAGNSQTPPINVTGNLKAKMERLREADSLITAIRLI